MNSQALLILGSQSNQDYIEALSNFGFETEVRGSVRHSLEKVHHRRFSGVVVDRKFTHADVLEFILNVRDINRTIPVVVIGPGKDKQIEGKIDGQDRTIILNEFDRGQELAKEMVNALKNNGSADV